MLAVLFLHPASNGFVRRTIIVLCLLSLPRERRGKGGIFIYVCGKKECTGQHSGFVCSSIADGMRYCDCLHMQILHLNTVYSDYV